MLNGKQHDKYQAKQQRLFQGAKKCQDNLVYAMFAVVVQVKSRRWRSTRERTRHQHKVFQ